MKKINYKPINIYGKHKKKPIKRSNSTDLNFSKTQSSIKKPIKRSNSTDLNFSIKEPIKRRNSTDLNFSKKQSSLKKPIKRRNYLDSLFEKEPIKNYFDNLSEEQPVVEKKPIKRSNYFDNLSEEERRNIDNLMLKQAVKQKLSTIQNAYIKKVEGNLESYKKDVRRKEKSCRKDVKVICKHWYVPKPNDPPSKGYILLSALFYIIMFCLCFSPKLWNDLSTWFSSEYIPERILYKIEAEALNNINKINNIKNYDGYDQTFIESKSNEVIQKYLSCYAKNKDSSDCKRKDLEKFNQLGHEAIISEIKNSYSYLPIMMGGIAGTALIGGIGGGAYYFWPEEKVVKKGWFLG